MIYDWGVLNMGRKNLAKKRISALIIGVLLSISTVALPDQLTAKASSDIATNGNLAENVQEKKEEQLEEIELVDPADRGEGFAAVLYNNSNGLPTSEANAVAQTADGFIWIASYSGLVRYDGNSFTRYDSSQGLTSIVSLFVDSKDRLWIGTNDSGVAVMDKGKFTFFDQKDGLRSSTVRAITEDSEGIIYVATTHGLTFIDQNLQVHPMAFSQLENAYVDQLCCGADDIIYGLTNDGSIFGIKGDRIIYFYSSKDITYDNIHCICADPVRRGYIYMGSDKSRVFYVNLDEQMKAYRVHYVKPQVKINKISVHGGYIWICADNGIGRVNPKGEYYAIENVPMTSSVDDMIVDHEGNLWFASSRQGVMKIVPDIFRNVSSMAGLNTMVVNSVCMRNNMIYAGTDEGLIILDKELKPHQNALTELLEGSRIRCIMLDEKENLWLSTYSDYGLVCYTKKDEILHYGQEAGILSKKVRSTTMMSDGTIMVATSGGLNLIKNGKVTASYNDSNGISNTEILTACEGPNGKLYLGSDGDGIYIVDGRNVTRLSKQDGLKSEVILRIKKDAKRDLYWIITSNSIAYMKDEVITNIQDFPYSNNFDVFSDDMDNLWVLSSNGIYIVNTENMLQNTTIDYIFYDSKCGLPCVATANSYSYLDKKGILFIAGNSGITSVNTKEAYEDISDIRLSVPFIGADDEIIYPDKNGKLVIPSSTRRITIYPYAFTYSLRNPKITYELLKVDSAGGTTVTKQELDKIGYTNLKGGTYKFLLTMHNTADSGEDKQLIVTIEKKKSIYEELWFRGLLALLFVGILAFLVAAYIKQKTKKYLKKQEENQKFISEMVDAFARCVDAKDKYTKGHSFRVAQYTQMFAARMGYKEEELEDVHRIALLHDIGKISIKNEILNKPGKLTDDEFVIMKSHAMNGYEILKDITVMPNLALGAGYHHERYDGKGYPRGLKGDEIPMIAQIIAVADCLDAMTSTRPYRKAMPLSKALGIINEIAGTQLNPEVVKTLMDLVEEGAFEDLRRETEGENEVTPADNMKENGKNTEGDKKGDKEEDKEGKKD